MSFNSSVIVMTQEETVHNPLQKHRPAFPTEAKWLRPPPEAWQHDDHVSAATKNDKQKHRHSPVYTEH